MVPPAQAEVHADPNPTQTHPTNTTNTSPPNDTYTYPHGLASGARERPPAMGERRPKKRRTETGTDVEEGLKEALAPIPSP